MSSRSQKVAKEHHFKNAYEEEDLADRLEKTKQKVREDMPTKVLASERSAIVRAMLAAEVHHIQARLDVIGTTKPFSATSTSLQTVTHLFQRSRNTIHEVYDKALKDGEQGDSEDEDEDSDGDDGQIRGGRPRRINDTPELRSELIKKIHAQRVSGKCVNAIHVLNWLIELKAITCDKSNLLQYDAALRCTQRLVHDVTNLWDFRCKHEAGASSTCNRRGSLTTMTMMCKHSALRPTLISGLTRLPVTDLQQLAAAKVHKLIYAPAGVPQLEPIELFWNQLKSPIIAPYSAGRTMFILKELQYCSRGANQRAHS